MKKLIFLTLVFIGCNSSQVEETQKPKTDSNQVIKTTTDTTAKVKTTDTSKVK